MSKYKNKYVDFEGSPQLLEQVVGRARFYVQQNSDHARNLILALSDFAIQTNDEELKEDVHLLFEELQIPKMSCASVLPTTNEPASEKNLPNPTKENGTPWDNSLDGIFNMKIKPNVVKDAIEGVTSEKISGKRFYYVAFKILKIIKWILSETSDIDFLRWINLHFNYGWDETAKHQFQFRLEGSAKNLKKIHPSEWNDNTVKGDKGRYYRELALLFKNTFTQTIENEKAVDNSESFEHLKDRPQFLSGAKDICGEYYVPDEAYINNGK